MSKLRHLIKFSGVSVCFRFRGFISGVVMVFFCINALAQGDLLISPLRVVFEGPKKSHEISLANVGKDSATYAVSLVDIRMKEDGSFETVTEPDPGQNFAGPYVRFFPRRVTLAPNESQVVKVQLVKTSQMAPGEYRSHLYFRAVPDEKPLGEQNTKKDTAGISIQLKPIFGITIPIIVRVGDNNSDVTFSGMEFEKVENKPVLSVNLNRTGNMSVYGELTVDYVTPGGKSTQVKIVKGLGVYTPNSMRRFKVELDDDKNIGYNKGKLHVRYRLQTSDKTEKVVEGDLELK